MAHHKSAKKRIRQTKFRTQVNGNRISRIRTFVRKAEEAIATGTKEQAVAAFRAMEPELARGVRANLVHRNTAARKLSRLSARIKSLAA